jgi:hypothetical protein
MLTSHGLSVALGRCMIDHSLNFCSNPTGGSFHYAVTEKIRFYLMTSLHKDNNLLHVHMQSRKLGLLLRLLTSAGQKRSKRCAVEMAWRQKEKRTREENPTTRTPKHEKLSSTSPQPDCQERPCLVNFSFSFHHSHLKIFVHCYTS